MKKLSALALVSVLFISACGAGPGTAAITIDGVSTTKGEIDSMFIRPSTPITKERFATDLNFFVQWTLVTQAVKDRWGVEFSAEEIEAEAQAVVEELANTGETREAFLTRAGVTELYLQRHAHLQLLDAIITTKLTEELTPDIERATADDFDEDDIKAGREAQSEVCAAHILATNLSGMSADELAAAKPAAKTQAEELIDRILAGEKFEDLAKEYGKDGTAAQGGDLGCAAPAGYVTGFREAIMTIPVGSVHPEPIESQFGFHVVMVSKRTIPSDDEIVEKLIEDKFKADLDKEIAADAEEWLVGFLRQANIEVNKRFGTWTTDPTPAVLPPDA